MSRTDEKRWPGNTLQVKCSAARQLERLLIWQRGDLGEEFALERIEHMKPLGRYQRTFELAGSILLMLTGLYLLNGWFAFFPWLTW